MPLVARTMVLNAGLNAAKILFRENTWNETTDTKTKIIKTCCVVKSFCSWHQEVSARISRERCGGASFLAKNRIGDLLWGSHSGMTAEGDNRVLMQKIVKDIFEHTQKQLHDAPAFSKDQLAQLKKSESMDLGTLRDLIFMREMFEIKTFGKIMKKKIIDDQRKFYDVWMFESNDNIQSMAWAYGERYMLQSAFQLLDSMTHQGAKAIFEKVLRLHMIDLLNKDLSFYLVNDLISTKLAA